MIDITNDILLTPDAIGVNFATPSGHRKCYMQITVKMPGAEDHIIAQSQDEIYILRLQSRITITLLPSRDGNQ